MDRSITTIDGLAQQLQCCAMVVMSAAIFCCLASLYGCSDGGDEAPIVIDFSESAPAGPAPAAEDAKTQIFGAVSAMISPKETFDLYRRLMLYVSQRLDRKLVFVQRKTYSEISAMFLRGELDFAFVCSGPYATGAAQVAVATPVVQGGAQYHSYLIVSTDSPAKDLEDLRGKRFAFTDPHSNTGRLAPLSWLMEAGETPETFFSDSIFTYSHDNSIMAVAQNLVDGAAVDSLIWEYLSRRGSPHVSKTRIIRRSKPFGNPPIVVSSRLSPTLQQRIQQVLLSLHETPEGAAILKDLAVERFVQPQEEWYEPIRIMHNNLVEWGLVEDVPLP